MAVHPQFAAAIRAQARSVRPDIAEADLEAVVSRVAAAPGFASCADFLDDGLRGIYFGEAALEGVVKIALAAPTPAPVSEPQFNHRNPIDRLGAIYRHQAGEREDIEGAALDARVADGEATPLDKLTHARREPTKKAKETPVDTRGLEAITNPERRLEEFRRRTHASKSRETLELERSAYEKKALDKTLDPMSRVAANSELARVLEALKKLDA